MSEQLSWREIILKGHRTLPHVKWAAPSRWKLKFSTFAILIFGLTLFGIAEGMFVAAGIGNSPWVVFAQGLSIKTGLDIGMTTFLTSAVVLLLWIPLRERPGLGTISNMIVIAVVLDITVYLLPPATSFGQSLAMVLTALIMCGFASAFYLTTRLGPGPRDGLMTSIHNKTGVRVSRVRLSIEVTVLLAGYLLGGTVGIGTLIFALGIGRSIAFGLGVVGRLAEHPDARPQLP
jgi:uncharacterized membrane protein YczE